MKAKSLAIRNIGIIEDTKIVLDKPLLLFYGEIRQGKTTLLNAVKWVMGGSYPSDIIRHGSEEAEICFEFDGGSVSRSWYRAKDGSTKDRPIVLVRDGKSVLKPTTEIKKFLNPFLLDQDFLRNMTEIERKKYFLEVFGVDTKDLDTEYLEAEEQARNLRAKIKGYGEIDTTPVKLIDVSAVRMQLSSIRSEENRLAVEHAQACERIRESHQKEILRIEEQRHACLQRAIDRDRIEDEIKDLKLKIVAKEKWLKDHQQLSVDPAPTKPTFPKAPIVTDTTELEAQISQAVAQAVRFEQYQRNLQRMAEKEADILALGKWTAKQSQLKQKKSARLAGIAKECRIADLSFDDDGNLIYQGTTAGMLSTSQIMTLSSELSAMYPEGFGIELIDRAESLGKSIFGFVEKAKRKELTILAAIVGEKPAQTPDEIGVFVVNEGRVE